ncbi:MAG: methyltransferase domain-containing protein [Acidimicrobiia bacterium]
MVDARTGQVAAAAAEIYDEFFLPALFEQWAPQLCDAAMMVEGQSVLDVACGTGILARVARSRVGPSGQVTGVDINDGMLTVARRHDPSVTWEQAPAESLPFDDDAFDVVVSQFGLMFFDDPMAAIREMRRVARPGGQIAVAVWTGLDLVPGYAAMVELLDQLFGADVADALRVPYALGHRDDLTRLSTAAGLDASVTTRPGVARFPSIDAWVHTDVRGWTLADMISDDDLDRLLAAARVELASFVDSDGTVAFDHPAHIVVATA